MPGVPRTSSPGHVRSFPGPIPTQANRVVSGLTKDSGGAPLGLCTVDLFNSATDIREQSVISDASGNYSFTVDPTMHYYCVAYLVGSPDVSGTTVNTLAGV
jgi:hypothetical protein